MKGEPAVYPRVGGGNSVIPVGSSTGSGLSPRGRGKRLRFGLWYQGRRSIPAWAGETGVLVMVTGNIKVYPRVGGGNAKAPAALISATGLSPRGRGKRSSARWSSPIPGSIPAWAGETPAI